MTFNLNNPESRVEEYLSVIAQIREQYPAIPESRVEAYLEYIIENGGGGGSDPATRAMLAPNYNSSTAYLPGDFAIYQNKLYKAINETTGLFNIDDWAETSVDQEIISVLETIQEIPVVEANDSAETTAKLVKLKIAGINYSLASGGASVFTDYAAMVNELNEKESGELELGWNIYIVTLNVPDLWVSKNDEETSVPYTYTTDAQFIEDLRSAADDGGLQIGYYRVCQLEADKVTIPVQDVTLDGVSMLDGNIAELVSTEIVYNAIISGDLDTLTELQAKIARQWLKTGARIVDEDDPNGDLELTDVDNVDLVEALSNTSTHNEIATAKAVYDAILAAKPHIIYHE